MKSLKELYRQQREAIAEELRQTKEDGTPLLTYQQIANSRAISRERVRQIAKKYGLCRRSTVSPTAEEAST